MTPSLYQSFFLRQEGLFSLSVISHAGAAFDVEVWAMPLAAVGSFLQDGVKPPLCIGDVRLEDGKEVKGFLGYA